MNRFTTRLITCLLLTPASLPLLAAVTASVDHNRLAPGDTLELTLQYDGSTSSQPDLSPLKTDFDILGSGRASNFQIINGHVSEQVQVQLELSPRHAGQLTIPPLHWGNGQSAPISISVGAAAAPGSSQQPQAQPGSNAAASAPSHVFLTEDIDNSEPYMQNAVVLTVRLYYDVALYQANLDLASSGDILVQPLGKDQQSQAVRNGHRYTVAQRQYLLVPQHSGHLTLNGPVLDAEVAVGGANDPFFGNIPFANMLAEHRPIRLRGKPLDLDVRPPPTDAAGHALLPLTQLTLNESWKPNAGPIRAGEPLTRHLSLHALGVSASALPDLSALMTLPDGIKAYPDQAKTQTGQQGGQVSGSSDQDIALIASRPGHYTLPPVHLSWWDTGSNVQRDTTLPARTLDVLPAAAATTLAASPPPETVAPPPALAPAPVVTGHGERVWQLATAGLGALWSLTALGWVLDRRRLRRPALTLPVVERPVSAAAAMKAFQQACRQHSPLPARQHLLAWAQARWPQEEALTGLGALAQRLDDVRLLPLFAELDRACYARGPWNGEPLLRASKAWDSGRRKAAGKGDKGLADLYD